jgi:ankyrin repeat protein
MVELLVARGADIRAVNRTGSTALHRAIAFPDGYPTDKPMTREHLDVVAYLLDHGANVHARGFLGDSPLHLAASNGYIDAVKLLLDRGADPNARNDTRGTPLHDAAMQGRNDVVAYLLSRGADPNSRSNYNAPLSLAVRFSHKDVVATLLAHGADARTVEYGGKSLLDEIVDRQGPWTPERREIAEMVLAGGADIQVGEGRGGTPLHGAVRRGAKELATFLLDHRANINAKDQYGQTPLHDAVDQKQLEMVKLLISRGAEINPLDNQGRTPMYYAWSDGVDARIKEFLRKHGGVGGFGEPRP